MRMRMLFPGNGIGAVDTLSVLFSQLGQASARFHALMPCFFTRSGLVLFGHDSILICAISFGGVGHGKRRRRYMQGGTQQGGKKNSLENGVHTANLPSIVYFLPLLLLLLLPVKYSSLLCCVCCAPSELSCASRLSQRHPSQCIKPNILNSHSLGQKRVNLQENEPSPPTIGRTRPCRAALTRKKNSS
ncbi:hypothetical protein V8C34DRAFT_121485 [Trichoderma compactum]